MIETSNEWTKQELKLLIDQYSRGANYEVLLRLLPGRTRKAIEDKATRLGLRRDTNTILDNARVGYLDIESNGLKANFHMILSWFIKERGKDVFHAYTLSKKDFNLKDKTQVDRQCTEKLISTLSQFDIVCTYYGTGFDLPFIRTRALYYGIPFPPYGAVKHFDIYYTVREKMCLNSKRLETASKFLGIQGKTPLSGEIWVAAGLGDEKALSYVREHNKQDTIVLEKLHDKLIPFMKGTRRSI
ncbi:MAG: ribonuclease H-like domain-containing protein [Candidatus Blackburnbacteria bacterium]|nr:ribonuclease H-like domain-containing protein [Candidatus Blackburnbacteria bacterium]